MSWGGKRRAAGVVYEGALLFTGSLGVEEVIGDWRAGGLWRGSEGRGEGLEVMAEGGLSGEDGVVQTKWMSCTRRSSEQYGNKPRALEG